MATIGWKDLDKAKVGDIIVAEGQVAYVVNIRERGTRTNQVTPERRITLGEYNREFYDDASRNSGYSFDCFKDGSFPERIMFNGQSIQEYVDTIAAEMLIDDGVIYDERSFNEPGSIRCQCGEEVFLEMVMTNTCDKCHRDYNISGQLLAPRSQWGWDTGETSDEILNSDWGINESPTDDWSSSDY